MGQLLQVIRDSPVAVRFDAKIHTADRVATSAFEIRQKHSFGSSFTVPWKEFGLMQGPGRVEITATNVGSLHVGVVAGAVKITRRGAP